MIKHSQYTQSNKFPISLQYLKKEFRNGVCFLHADKYQGVYKGVRKNAPEKKAPRKNAPEKIAPRK